MAPDAADPVAREHARPCGHLVERVVAREPQWHGRIFDVERLRVELPDGSSGEREVVRHHGGAGVVAVRDGRICLVRQHRVVVGRVTLEIPAGKVDPGEAPEDAAARELREEAGLVAGRLVPLLTSLASPGFTDEHTHVFLAEGLSDVARDPDEGELLDVAWLEGDAVVAAVLSGELQDSKTVAGVLAARALGML